MSPGHREQFRALTRAFLARFFENEITSGTDDLKTSFFWLLSFLAVPGLFMPMTMAHTWQFVVLKQGPDALRELTRGDKAFYLGFVMVATAAVTAIAWNSLLADRRDGLVLGVLPVRPVMIVAARLAALAMYITLVAVAMNALAAFSFGLFLATGSTFAFVARGFAAHFTASVLASACVFLCVAGFQGVVLAVAGPRLFSRVAPLLQLALVGLIVAGLLLLPVIDVSVADTLAGRGPGARPWLLLTPPLWFLGLYEVVLGTTDRLLHDLASRAVLVTAAGLTATLCSYPFAYRRIMTAVVQETSTGAGGSRLRDAARLVTRMTGRAPDVHAVSQFFLATLGRVERHRFTIAASIGVVVAWALPGAIAIASSRPAAPRVELLSLPLAAMVFLVAGLRIAVALPADGKAAWMFEVSPPGRGSGRSTMERTMIAFGILPVVMLFAVLYSGMWGISIGLSHAAICLGMGVLLVQAALWKFHGMPCARPWNPDGAHLSRRWWMYLFGFLLFTVGVPSYELLAFGNAVALAILAVVPLAAAGFVRFFSLKHGVVEIDRSAFAPGDVLSLN
jgi:hypothetical protein